MSQLPRKTMEQILSDLESSAQILKEELTKNEPINNQITLYKLIVEVVCRLNEEISNKFYISNNPLERVAFYVVKLFQSNIEVEFMGEQIFSYMFNKDVFDGSNSEKLEQFLKEKRNEIIKDLSRQIIM